ncbi:hypothetical protein [Mycolicibacterium sp. 624]|uniref:hypothetical protein n=1 Tax=Mycolicibacterium sp. 624 TaxID=3156314 RepID=UPI003392DE95
MTAMKTTLIALATVMGLTACSAGTDTTSTGASTVTVTAPTTSTASPPPTAVSEPSSTAASPSADSSGCELNPSDAPVETADPYQWVPQIGRVSVTMSGLPSGTIKPGDPPVVVDVTACNDSPVSYSEVGVVVVLDHCSCAPGPLEVPVGTVEYFDRATGGWTQVDHPAAGTGMDYLGQFANAQELSKGQAFTVRYRIALDTSMTAGQGGVSAAVVTPYPLNQIGSANLPFTVVQ